MTTLIVHPGSPKTATSTLQHILRLNRARLSRAGVGLILPEDLRGHDYLGLYLAAYRGRRVDNIAQATNDFFAPYLARYDRVICSEETFCHDFMPSRKFGTGGIDRGERAAEILSDCGAAQVRIVLTIRPQAALLSSTYAHFVHRQHESRDFKGWLDAEVDLGALLWQPAVRAFEARFGAAAVDVVPMTAIAEVGMDGYMSRILASFGLGGLTLKLDTEEVHNPSPSMRAVQLCRVMNREVLNPMRAELVNDALVDIFPVEEFGKFSPQNWTMPEALAQTFAEDYAAALA